MDQPILGQRKRSKLDLFVILCFSCLGIIISKMTRTFPSGFYFNFIEKEEFSKSLGGIAVSAMLVTTTITSLIYNFIPGIVSPSLKVRCVVVFMLNALFLGLSSLVNPALDLDTDGWAALGVVFVTRSLQGVTAAVMFIIVQGELVDLYLKEYKMLIVIASSSMYIGVMVAAYVGTELYVAGGWVIVGVGTAILSILPLVLFPLVDSVLRKAVTDHEGDGSSDSQSNNTMTDQSTNFSTNSTRFCFFVPDMAVFLINSIFTIIIYSLPERMVKHNGISLDSAVFLTNLVNLIGFISGLGLGAISARMKNVLSVMVVGNICFYVGVILMFGSTTQSLHFFSAQVELGCLLAGLGDSSLFNLCIMSKFLILEKLGVTVQENLATVSSAIFNTAMGFSAVLGVVLSASALSRESEIVWIGVMVGLCILTTVLLMSAVIVTERCAARLSKS